METSPKIRVGLKDPKIKRFGSLRILSDPISPRALICSYKLYAWCKEAFPKREVERSAYVHHDEFYYFGVGGEVRRVDTSTGDVWGCDWNVGVPWMKKQRTVAWLKRSK